MITDQTLIRIGQAVADLVACMLATGCRIGEARGGGTGDAATCRRRRP